MLRRTVLEFWRDRQAAVAPLYAIALFGLVGIAGIGMDYGRLMAMSSEMQNAADQAALAAATQLDGKSDSITRAQNAVTQYFANSAPSGASGELVVNRTVLANDSRNGRSSGLTNVSFTFYTDYNRGTDAFGSTTSDGTAAKVVLVQVNARRAYYALTPVVDAFSSRDITVDAVAGLDSAICQTPPLMVCAPSGGADFPTNADIGKGLLLQPGSAGAWAPGTFGYLDFGHGATTVKQLLGSNSGVNECTASTGVTAQQGNIASAPDYLNTRFDIYAGGASPPQPSDCLADGSNCPAASTRKDLVREEMYTYKKEDSSQPMRARPDCSSAVTSQTLPGGDKIDVTEWVSASEIPGYTSAEGFPRDACHKNATSGSNGTCSGGNYGDGDWSADRTKYRASHPNVPVGLSTRYDIYKWERDNQASGLQPTRVAIGNSAAEAQFTSCNPAGNNCTVVFTNYCSYPSPIKATYHPTAKDRRIQTVAVVDCSGGTHTFSVNRWMDVFLTEPSWDRNTPYTRKTQIYGEIVGPASRPDNTTAFQFYGRNKVVLLR